MKIAEVREELKKYDQKTLIDLFVNAYKEVPRIRKEDSLDPLILDYKGVMDLKKTALNINGRTVVDFESLEHEINGFIEDAYAHNYFMPNKRVPKAKRPKWRFMVKNYYKQLIQIKIDDPSYNRSVDLLYDLYKLISYACNHYLFSTEDPFRSVGIEQQEFYQIVAERTFSKGYSPQKIRAMIILTASGGTSRGVQYSFLYSDLLTLINTTDLRSMAIKEGKQLLAEANAKCKELRAQEEEEEFSYNVYVVIEQERVINQLAELVMYIYVDLGEVMEGISFFYEMYKEGKEATLQKLLEIVESAEDDRIWKQVYEDGVSRKISPPKLYEEKYEKIKSLYF